jgi:hypothetical protein
MIKINRKRITRAIQKENLSELAFLHLQLFPKEHEPDILELSKRAETF